MKKSKNNNKVCPDGLRGDLQKRLIKEKKLWFYMASAHSFDGFFQYESESTNMNIDLKGPFKTLKAAKADAIDYFRTDIIYARLAIKEIRKAKNLDS